MAKNVGAECGVCVLVLSGNFTKLSLTVNKCSFVSYYEFHSQKLQCYDFN